MELKRTEQGGHMELQALRYAAMVSTMTLAQAVRAHRAYLTARGSTVDAEGAILGFLGWESADENQFGAEVRITLVSADFSKELTSCVLWLNERDLDIRCVQIRPYVLDGRQLIDVKQVLPLPEAQDYQVRVREKEREERSARTGGPDLTRYDVVIDGDLCSRMFKRRAAHLVVSTLCERGVDPEEIEDAIPWRRGKLWFVLDGLLEADEFHELAKTARGVSGRRFSSRYWLSAEGELIQKNGKTYALAKRWGPRTLEAMSNLLERFPDKGISCSEHRAAT